MPSSGLNVSLTKLNSEKWLNVSHVVGDDVGGAALALGDQHVLVGAGDGADARVGVVCDGLDVDEDEDEN